MCSTYFFTSSPHAEKAVDEAKAAESSLPHARRMPASNVSVRRG